MGSSFRSVPSDHLPGPRKGSLVKHWNYCSEFTGGGFSFCFDCFRVNLQSFVEVLLRSERQKHQSRRRNKPTQELSVPKSPKKIGSPSVRRLLVQTHDLLNSTVVDGWVRAEKCHLTENTSSRTGPSTIGTVTKGRTRTPLREDPLRRRPTRTWTRTHVHSFRPVTTELWLGHLHGPSLLFYLSGLQFSNNWSRFWMNRRGTVLFVETVGDSVEVTPESTINVTHTNNKKPSTLDLSFSHIPISWPS